MNEEIAIPVLRKRINPQWRVFAVLLAVYGPPLLYNAVIFPRNAFLISLIFGTVVFPGCYLDIAFNSLVGADISNVSYVIRVYGGLAVPFGVIFLARRGYISLLRSVVILISQLIFLAMSICTRLPFPPDLVRY